MKLVDFRHVAKQDDLLAQQGAGDEVSHGWVVHLSRISLERNIEMRHTAPTYTPAVLCGDRRSPPAHTAAPPRTPSPSPAVHSSRGCNTAKQNLPSLRHRCVLD